MKIKPDKLELWNKGLANNPDPYGRRCYTFAEGWADKMERDMATGKTIPECAAACSSEEDTDGITGFMYGMAVSILSSVWEHGETLLRWHTRTSKSVTRATRRTPMAPC